MDLLLHAFRLLCIVASTVASPGPLPGPDKAGRRLNNDCDATRCLEDGRPDIDCCTSSGFFGLGATKASCADGYTMTMTGDFGNCANANTCCHGPDREEEGVRSRPWEVEGDGLHDVEKFFKDLGGGSLVGGIFAMVGIVLGICLVLACIGAACRFIVDHASRGRTQIVRNNGSNERATAEASNAAVSLSVQLATLTAQLAAAQAAKGGGGGSRADDVIPTHDVTPTVTVLGKPATQPNAVKQPPIDAARRV